MLRPRLFLAALLTAAVAVAALADVDPTEAEPESALAASEAEAVEEAAPPLVHVVRWDDAITPVTRRFLSESLAAAREEGAVALVIELDTPGGLLDTTRDIVSELLDSPIPVLVWVGPAGARAASAGTFITLASHIAAMAPGTNIGAASPITMGGGGADSTLSSKMFNDTAAFVRSIAERRGRNVEWAESAVREAEAITQTEALELGVIDLVVPDVEQLLEESHGRTVELPSGDVELALDGARIERRELGMRYRLLSYLANPNIAYILMMFGIYGIFFELSNPGSVFPGVVGVIFLILAFFSMQTLPMNLAGLLLIIVGMVLFLLEAQIQSFGLLTLGGIVSTVLGSIMLFDSPEPALRASLWVIVPITVVSSLLFAMAIGLSVKTLRSRPTTGREGMIGLVGVVRSPLSPRGTIEVHGEIWQAEAPEPLSEGERVEVESMDGLLLKVKRT